MSSKLCVFAIHILCLRCSIEVSSITMLQWGHNSSPCANQDGPFHHWLLCHSSSGFVPLDRTSAGLSSYATWCQIKFDVLSWISDTLLATYVFHLVGWPCNQVKTSLDSVHRWTLSMGIHKIGNTFLINLASNCAPQSSSLGMDICFTGDTLDIEHTSCESKLLLALPKQTHTSSKRSFRCITRTMNLYGSHLALNLD